MLCQGLSSRGEDMETHCRMQFAAAAAKSLQSCPTLCDPIDGSPPGSAVPGILQARTLEWVAISFSNAWKGKVKVKSLSRVRLLATPWTAAYQAPLSMGFFRQEYWSGVPLPSPRMQFALVEMVTPLNLVRCYRSCAGRVKDTRLSGIWVPARSGLLGFPLLASQDGSHSLLPSVRLKPNTCSHRPVRTSSDQSTSHVSNLWQGPGGQCGTVQKSLQVPDMEYQASLFQSGHAWGHVALQKHSGAGSWSLILWVWLLLSRSM